MFPISRLGCASGRFRSDDIKIGSILAYIGSNSSATYFPTQVMLSDTESHAIELKVLPKPHFEGGKKSLSSRVPGMLVRQSEIWISRHWRQGGPHIRPGRAAT